jgi:hypothetical protein
VKTLKELLLGKGKPFSGLLFLPYSKGGSFLVVENIQILCARHNLEKSDRIE